MASVAEKGERGFDEHSTSFGNEASQFVSLRDLIKKTQNSSITGTCGELFYPYNLSSLPTVLRLFPTTSAVMQMILFIPLVISNHQASITSK